MRLRRIRAVGEKPGDKVKCAPLVRTDVFHWNEGPTSALILEYGYDSGAPIARRRAGEQVRLH